MSEFDPSFRSEVNAERARLEKKRLDNEIAELLARGEQLAALHERREKLTRLTSQAQVAGRLALQRGVAPVFHVWSVRHGRTWFGTKKEDRHIAFRGWELTSYSVDSESYYAMIAEDYSVQKKLTSDRLTRGIVMGMDTSLYAVDFEHEERKWPYRPPSGRIGMGYNPPSYGTNSIFLADRSKLEPNPQLVNPEIPNEYHLSLENLEAARKGLVEFVQTNDLDRD